MGYLLAKSYYCHMIRVAVLYQKWLVLNVSVQNLEKLYSIMTSSLKHKPGIKVATDEQHVLLSGVFVKLDIIEGDGGVGTVLDVVFQPGAVPQSYKERFDTVDHENRILEVSIIEGGYLDMGCTSYLNRMHVIEITSKSCVIKSSVIYDVKEVC
ncbi:S-norcoclaurine synthase 2-like [Papaver somniferum]|uniref:S-norcoclaurine synthase 2-like n=1 Tax=Papaver somniferum TaxID=3469 RepID=UPI000E6F65E9|nr:S-norcoclaurine synthase 2-like [Papaver somniferum]